MILKSVSIELVEHMDQVLRKALVLEDPEAYLRKPRRARRDRAGRTCPDAVRGVRCSPTPTSSRIDSPRVGC